MIFLLLAIVTNVHYWFSYKVSPQKFSHIEQVYDELSPRLAAGQLAGLPYTLKYIGLSINAKVWVTAADGRPLYGEAPADFDLALIHLPSLAESIPLKNLNNPEHGSRTLALPIMIGSQSGYLMIDPLVTQIYDATIIRLQDFFALPVIIGILAATILGYFMYSRLQKNVDNIQQASENFAAGDYSSRAEVDMNSDLAVLTTTFNDMADTIVHTQKTRQQFFSNISHELKAPLSNIRCITESLQDGIAETETERQHYLENINQNTLRMIHIVEHLLALERIEDSQQHFTKEKIDLIPFLSFQVNKVKPFSDSKLLSLTLPAPQPPIMILANRQNLAIALENLLTNAIKWSPRQGTITISIKKLPSKIEISVQDQGPGISKKDLAHLWDRFYQADHGEKTTVGGSGIGLSITRSLILGMGGNIEVFSHEGNGSTFTIEFPAIINKP